MRLLLDTHIFLWYLKNDSKLPKSICDKIDNSDEVYISSASIWEAAIKIKLKKLDADINELINSFSKLDFIELPITAKHAATVCNLKNVHSDPFDRILIAQAISEPLTFLTADTLLKKYSDLVEVI